MYNISVNTMGGLGNVLFQVSAAYSISIRDNMNLIVDSTNHYGAHYGISKYIDNILRNVSFSEYTLSYPVHGEPGFHYNKIPIFTSDTKLNGYFQSEKYFIDYKNLILNLFSPTKEITLKLMEKYGKILEENNTISIHIRRGDYLGIPDYHPVLDIEYYKKSTEFFDSSDTYLIFSDDIEWCKLNFDFLKNKIFVDDLEDFEELHLMSMCNNNIIANSTFSWWGAWLNKNENKKVICPSIWFGPSLSYHNTSDIYCDKWIKI
jgi:hypothetical protein